MALAPVFAAPSSVFGAEGDDSQDRSLQPEEDDFGSTPYTEYGEFNEEESEAADMKFYQYGRLFGFGLGVGYSAPTGNRATLWEGGFPALDVRTQYFFDFNLAMGLSYSSWSHHYEVDQALGGNVEASVAVLGLDFKYYFDTKDLSAPISFANPYIVGGMANYTESLTAEDTDSPEKSSDFGINAGLGVEFAIKPKKSYLAFEGRYHMGVRFKDNDLYDTNSTPYDDLQGNFYTLMGGFLFTW